ncbi:MAG: ExbD/TolR family protein [Oligoflexales bacterium]
MASVGGDSGDHLSLNLTPMLDIFSILVTFLLMSYSTDPVNHDVDQDLELPNSATLTTIDEIPAITVNRQAIFINDKKIVDIENGDVPEAARDQGAIRPVYEELLKLAEANKKAVAKEGAEEKKKANTLGMEMDKNHNFKLMKRIMLSASQAEFITFKLLVAKDNP